MSGPSGRDPGVRLKTGKGRTASSTRWLTRQLNDPYVRQAKADGYRSRAAYKLAELDTRFGLLKGVKRVVDLGIAPGGWNDWSHACTAAPNSWCNETFYAEYNNRGPGWLPAQRVPWAHILNDTEGAKWTVASVLGGWAPSPP